jgi:hypothetical protein
MCAALCVLLLHSLSAAGAGSRVTRHSSNVTRHTSQVTRHASHVTRHISHASHILSLALHATSLQPLVWYKLLRLQIPTLDVVSMHLRILHNNIVQTLQEKGDKSALETAVSECTCASHFKLHLNFNNEKFHVGIGPCVSVQVEKVVSKQSLGASIQNDEICAANNCNLHGTKQWVC